MFKKGYTINASLIGLVIYFSNAINNPNMSSNETPLERKQCGFPRETNHTLFFKPKRNEKDYKSGFDFPVATDYIQSTCGKSSLDSKTVKVLKSLEVKTSNPPAEQNLVWTGNRAHKDKRARLRQQFQYFLRRVR